MHAVDAGIRPAVICEYVGRVHVVQAAKSHLEHIASPGSAQYSSCLREEDFGEEGGVSSRPWRFITRLCFWLKRLEQSQREAAEPR